MDSSISRVFVLFGFVATMSRLDVMGYFRWESGALGTWIDRHGHNGERDDV
jgi:hypothetical protein